MAPFGQVSLRLVGSYRGRCCGGPIASSPRHTGVFVGAGFAPAAARLHPEDRGSDAGALVFECR
jgi:hypothetical protein